MTVWAMSHGRPAGEDAISGQPVRGLDLAVVMSVDLENPPAEGLEHGGKVDTEPGIAAITSIRSGGLVRGRQTKLLKAVAVDDGGEVVELVAGSYLHRFPDHSLLNLSVTQHHPSVKTLAAELCAECDADPDGQALTEGAGGGVEPR